MRLFVCLANLCNIPNSCTIYNGSSRNSKLVFVTKVLVLLALMRSSFPSWPLVWNGTLKILSIWSGCALSNGCHLYRVGSIRSKQQIQNRQSVGKLFLISLNNLNWSFIKSFSVPIEPKSGMRNIAWWIAGSVRECILQYPDIWILKHRQMIWTKQERRRQNIEFNLISSVLRPDLNSSMKFESDSIFRMRNIKTSGKQRYCHLTDDNRSSRMEEKLSQILLITVNTQIDESL